MKYILSQDGEAEIFYGRYRDYLETIRSSLPASVYQFASDEKYFTLNSPHSLHDAWLNSVEIRENRNPERPFQPVVEATLKLLGQCHDRIIVLKYEGIVDYAIEGRNNPFNSADTFHGDIFTHEVRLSEKGNLVHELAYVSGGKIEIECRNFTHREELLASTSGKHAL